jgi:uncharacterized membrane protein YczE
LATLEDNVRPGHLLRTAISPPPRDRLPRRLGQLFAGLIMYGISDALLVLAGLGLDPWDVLHQGLARLTGIPIGTWSIFVGAAVLLMWIPLRQRPGVGTACNVVVIGSVINVVLAMVPAPHGLALRWLTLIGAVLLNGVATACYIGAGLGPGPRDGLMTGIARRGHSLRAVRTGIELAVLATGWLLGGTVGAGTVLYAVSIGPVVHLLLPRLTVAYSPASPAAPGGHGEQRRLLPAGQFRRRAGAAQRPPAAADRDSLGVQCGVQCGSGSPAVLAQVKGSPAGGGRPMVERWNRPPTVSALRTMFLPGRGNRLTPAVTPTWPRWAAICRAGRGEVREGRPSASPSRRWSPDCCWALPAAICRPVPRAGRRGQLRGQRDREPVRRSAGPCPPTGHRDHQPVGQPGGIAPDQTGAAAGRAAGDSQSVGNLRLATGTGPGPWPGHLACPWCDRMAGRHLQCHGRLPAAAARVFHGQLHPGRQARHRSPR